VRCLRYLSRRSLPLGGGVFTFEWRASEGLAPKVRNGEAMNGTFSLLYFL
jgi:hypothetical protein